MSDGSVERKLVGSPGGYERGDSGARVYMLAGLILLGADSVAVAGAADPDYDLRSGVRCYREYG